MEPYYHFSPIFTDKVYPELIDSFPEFAPILKYRKLINARVRREVQKRAGLPYIIVSSGTPMNLACLSVYDQTLGEDISVLPYGFTLNAGLRETWNKAGIETFTTVEEIYFATYGHF